MHTDTCDLPTILDKEQEVTATSVWPFKRRRNGKKVLLNEYQIGAIRLACSNKFSMIQGPPGQHNYIIAMDTLSEIISTRKCNCIVSGGAFLNIIAML